MRRSLPLAFIAYILCSCALLFPCSTSLGQVGGQTLTSLEEIKSHSGIFDETETAVDFEGVVTYQDPVWNFLFVQEGDHAVFVNGHRSSLLKRGLRVRVVGHLSKGDLNPNVNAGRIDVLCVAELPKAVPIHLAKMRIGDHDAQSVQLDCQVEQVYIAPHDTLIYARSEEKPVYLTVSRWENDLSPEKMVGKRIVCEGSLGIQLRDKTEKFPGDEPGEYIGAVKLFCQSSDSIRILEGEQIDLRGPSQDIRTLKESDKKNGDRFLTHGLVSFVDGVGPEEQIVIYDEHSAIRFLVPSTQGMFPGSVVRVGGVYHKGEDGLISYRADFINLLGQQAMYDPDTLSVKETLEEAKIDERMSVFGRPSRFVRDDDGLLLILSEGTAEIEVRLCGAAVQMAKTLDPQIAKRVRIIGVVTPATRKEANAPIQLVVANPGDIELLEEYVFPVEFAFSVLSILAVAIFLWIHTLRQQVAQKTQDAVNLTAQLRSSYESIEDGLLAVDIHGSILAVNKEFCRILGYQLYVGQTFDAACQEFVRQLKEPHVMEGLYRRCNCFPGESVRAVLEVEAPKNWTIHLASAPILPHKGANPVGRIWVLRDETEQRRLEVEQRRLEGELTRSNKLEAVGRLAGGVAHDFNNILTAITANLSMARSEGERTVYEVMEELTLAEDAAFQGAKVVRRLLTFSKEVNLSLTPHRLHNLITQLAKLLRHSFDASYTIQLDLCAADPVVKVDSAALEQVLMNLYVNARDAMPNGGQITTSTSVVRKGSDSVCRISIGDQGEGIEDHLREMIFEPFFSTKEPDEGTGLGLSTSFRVVEQWGGTLRLADTGVDGTEFHVELPLSQEVPCEKPEQDSLFGSSHVLIVDDERAVRVAAARILESRGFDVTEAVDGEAALELLFEQDLEVDVVMLDLTMPKMSGMEVLAEIKTRQPDLPVVVCSGYLFQDRGESGHIPEGTITKPYQIEELVRKLNNVIEQGVRAKVVGKR